MAYSFTRYQDKIYFLEDDTKPTLVLTYNADELCAKVTGQIVTVTKRDTFNVVSKGVLADYATPSAGTEALLADALNDLFASIGTSGYPSEITLAGNGASFLEKISMNLIPGWYGVRKFGIDPDIDTATVPTDVWFQGGVYEFSTGDLITHISSSDATDTQAIEIYGITAAGLAVVQTKNLSGQTAVAIDTPLYRVNRMENYGSTDNAGNIYIYENTAIASGVPTDTSKIRGIIGVGDNQTLQSIYTIPGFVGSDAVTKAWVIDWRLGVKQAGGSGTREADGELRIREPGKVFQVKDKSSASSVGTTTNEENFSIWQYAEPMSDIRISVVSVSANNTQVTGGFTVIYTTT